MTRFWLIRHAIVEIPARSFLYGRMDVSICGTALLEQAASYRAIAGRLPRDAVWLVTPLCRTARTADAIHHAGYPAVQGLPHAELPARLVEPAHAFWPLGATETPPGGESMDQVVARVGETMERLATDHAGRDVVAVSHGGAIRAALAHATGTGAKAALHFAIQNLSLTVLERHAEGWRVVGVNECAGSFAP
jgi:alpha-ribazole phosphatase